MTLRLRFHSWRYLPPELCFPQAAQCAPRTEERTHHVKSEYHDPSEAFYRAWLASRTPLAGSDAFLPPGAHRPLSAHQIKLAYQIVKLCGYDTFALIWVLHPWRFLLMIIVQLLRGVLPAFKGYSQASIINEFQSFMTSGEYTLSHLLSSILFELIRIGFETVLDSFATANEELVQSSIQFLLEHKQIETRLRLDVPTLADPVVRDLLQESDFFVRSFGSMSSFGLFSMFDITRILTLISELVSHLFILSSLTRSNMSDAVLITCVLASAVPSLFPWLATGRTMFEDLDDPHELRLLAKQEKMRALAYSDALRQEVVFFGLGSWILRGWAQARMALLKAERSQSKQSAEFTSQLLSRVGISDLSAAVQNMLLMLLVKTSPASLGTFTLYRNSVQALFLTIAALIHSLRMAYQAIFLMSAYWAATTVKAHLRPTASQRMNYECSCKGMELQVKNLSYTYPGCIHPVLNGVNLTIRAGETLAIVGYNGSGKSTLAKVLLRIVDFDSGQLLVNRVDIRKYDPDDYHTHCTAVFQDFSKFNASAQENIAVGFIDEKRNRAAIESAIRLGCATQIVYSLPQGLKTKLDVISDEANSFMARDSCVNNSRSFPQHGLSGGEWQRIALSRAFMRAQRPEVELIVFDEATSSLDAHAQNRIFDSIDKVTHSSDGKRTKTVIFITHRLSTARRADKIAMMEHGTITEFGTHEELLRRDGQYAALYRAST
ncbi:P-loop containing nucleoside triphosphate hydrolase protein [Laetiporus sulphureus 93-53]|uniref:p-loop containing nucleoside triphosphate hydrolase protein n=1 Tax=Laetiporus sulphureus 93-53 TaxID=1314785 RepID=A0A165I9Z6_9APHY|nr:P-loop containing nucleoside triphosphate hydrolase protein [Laetiporus sulphureus 93-53]KZT12787.1 P-loop containing nucleoside triphosphate hydrolase protein [Laetiporus sulphureus 93-53]